MEKELNELLELAGVKDELVEMADVMTRKQNYGFLITVFLNDHNPPHAHIRDLGGKTIGQFLITEEAPKTAEDLILYCTEGLPLKMRKTIAEWANKVSSKPPYTYWDKLKEYWETFQESQY